MIKNEFLVQKCQKSTNHKLNNKSRFYSTHIKKSMPILNFEKIKKFKDKYTINNDNNNINNKEEISAMPLKDKKNKIKNINDSFSSIEKVSNNELDDSIDNNNKDKKNEKLDNNNINNNKGDNIRPDNSTRIRVHKYNKSNGENAKIKINVKNPPEFEYQQIEIKPATKGYYYRVVKKTSSNNFRKSKNYIKAKNSAKNNNHNIEINNNNNNNVQAIKIKTNLKPLKFNKNKEVNINQAKQIEIKRYPMVHSNKSLNQNSKTFDSQINHLHNKQNQNLESNININKETHHMVGYDRHFGIEENCPLCKNMKKKSQFMEEKIFGLNKRINQKPMTANENREDIYGKIKNNFFGGYRKEEEKNINNNLFKDLNLLYSSQTQNRIKQNMFKDMQRKRSAKKNLSVKNIFKINIEHSNPYNRNSLGSFSDIEFPAINSYFHS